MEKIWLQNYPKGVPAEIESNKRTLVDLFNETCAKYPNNRAITSHGESLTFKKVAESVENFAASLIDLGIKKGDRVAVIMPNVMQYPLAIFAILKIGAVVVNINPLYTEHEIQYLLENSAAKAVIVLNMMAAKLNNIHNIGELKHVIVTKVPDMYSCLKRGVINFVLKYIKRIDTTYDYPAQDFRCLIIKRKILNYNPDVKPDDLAFIQYTGATTGKPKGAMLSHANIVANIDQIHAWIQPQMNDLSKQVAIDALPLYHIFSLTANLFTFFFSGGENVMIVNPRDVADMVKTLNTTPFTIFSALDTLYNHLLNSPDFVNGKFKHFKYSVAGGMPARQSVADKWHDITGVIPTNCYGLTEASPAVTMNPVSRDFDGSVGFPIPATDIQIRDIETDVELPIGQTGVLYIKGPQVMKGYWNNPEQTAAAFDKDGWFNTKDVGYVNEQGKLFLNGRQSELIIVSGFNVYPAEVESILDSIPEIKESAVIGTTDEGSGEAVVAFVVLKSDMSITEQEIIKKCRDKLTSYKVPRQIFIINELPKTLVGKIDKVAVCNKYLKKA